MASPKKLRGFLMVEAVLVCLVLFLLGLSVMQISSGTLTTKPAPKNTPVAKQLAEVESLFLRQLAFADLETNGRHERKSIESAAGWESEVALSPIRKTGTLRHRRARIRIYQGACSIMPEYAVEVPLIESRENERLAKAQRMLAKATERCDAMLAETRSRIDAIKGCTCDEKMKTGG